MNLRQHDAWLVDLDGTLYQPKPLKLVMAAQLVVAGPRVLRIVARFRKEHEAVREQNLECLPSPYRIQLRRTADALRLSPDEVESVIERFMFERPLPWLRRFARMDLIKEIRSFRNAGGRTALVSDYPAQRKLKSLGLINLFDRVIASDEPGGPTRLKPAPDGYLQAAKALEVEPTRCLVLGDRPDADGAAAKAAGMEFRLIK